MLKRKTPLGTMLENFESMPQDQLVVDKNAIICAIIGHTVESAGKSKKGIKINTSKIPSAIDFACLISMLENSGTAKDDEDFPEIIDLRSDKKSLKAEAKKECVEERISKLQTEDGFTIAGLTALYAIVRYIREKNIKMKIFIGTAAVLAVVSAIVIVKMISGKKTDDYDEDTDDIEIEDPDDDNILDITDDELDALDALELEEDSEAEAETADTSDGDNE